jgi:hypothetical protein
MICGFVPVRYGGCARVFAPHVLLDGLDLGCPSCMCDMRLSHHVDDGSLEAASAFMDRAWYRMRYGDQQLEEVLLYDPWSPHRQRVLVCL